MSDYLDVASDVENKCVEEGGVDIFLEENDRQCNAWTAEEVYGILEGDRGVPVGSGYCGERLSSPIREKTTSGC